MYENLLMWLRDQASLDRYYNGDGIRYEEAADAIEDLLAWHNADVREIERQKSLIANMRPVVLCKDCEFYMLSNFVDNHMECVRFNHPTAQDDFCSHAVRVGEEQT